MRLVRCFAEEYYLAFGGPIRTLPRQLPLQPLGLQEGQLELHAISLVHLQFDAIKKQLKPGNPLFSVPQKLCLNDDVIALKKSAKEQLAEQKYNDYLSIANFFVYVRFSFQNLSLTNEDCIEVLYVMQKTLFQCLGDVIKTTEPTLQCHLWKNKTHQFLTNKYRHLPKMTPSNNRMRLFASGFVLFIQAALMCLSIASAVAVRRINNGDASDARIGILGSAAGIGGGFLFLDAGYQALKRLPIWRAMLRSQEDTSLSIRVVIFLGIFPILFGAAFYYDPSIAPLGPLVFMLAAAAHGGTSASKAFLSALPRVRTIFAKPPDPPENRAEAAETNRLRR